MTWQAWATLLVLGVTLFSAFRDAHNAWRYFAAAVLALYIGGINTLEQTLAGVLNEGVLTLALLFTLSSALYMNGLLTFWLRWLLPEREMNKWQVALRVLLPTSVASGFLNNTPIVALLMQPLKRWAEKYSSGAYAYLMPLSYAAIVGGTLTMVGTSTNLVVLGQLDNLNVPHTLTLFSPLWVGAPLLLLALVYFVWLMGRLKSNQTDQEPEPTGGSFVFAGTFQADQYSGKSIAEAGLRKLQHGYLYRIQRANGDWLDATSELSLKTGDTVYFLGEPELVNELQAMGLQVARDDSDSQQSLYEVVVPLTSGLVGKTPLALDFRRRFQATIVSLAHQDKNIIVQIGEREIQAGDMLLLRADRHWQGASYSTDFQLLNQTDVVDARPLTQQVGVLLGLLGAILLGSFTGIGLFRALLMYVFGLLLTGLVDVKQLWQAIPKPLLVVVIAALGLGQAVVQTGLAEITVSLLSGVVQGPVTALIVLYFSTWAITELLTNNAAAAIMLPFGVLLGDSVGLGANLVGICVMIAASCSFVSPFGYQTNLMVLSAGNYRPQDFLKNGLPLLVMVSTVTIGLLSWKALQ